MRRLCKWEKGLKGENARRKWKGKKHTPTHERAIWYSLKSRWRHVSVLCRHSQLQVGFCSYFCDLNQSNFRFSFFPFKKSFVHEFLWIFSVCVWVVYSFVVGYDNVYMYLWLERIAKTTELLWCFKPKLYRFRTIHLKSRVFFHFPRLHSFFLSLNASSIMSRARTVHWI